MLFGHTERRGDEKLVKKQYDFDVRVTRYRGRPRYDSMEEVIVCIKVRCEWHAVFIELYEVLLMGSSVPDEVLSGCGSCSQMGSIHSPTTKERMRYCMALLGKYGIMVAFWVHIPEVQGSISWRGRHFIGKSAISLCQWSPSRK